MTDNVKEFGDGENTDFETVFVLTDFDSPDYNYLYKHDNRIVGPPVVLHCASKEEVSDSSFSLGHKMCHGLVSPTGCNQGLIKLLLITSPLWSKHGVSDLINIDFKQRTCSFPLTYVTGLSCGEDSPETGPRFILIWVIGMQRIRPGFASEWWTGAAACCAVSLTETSHRMPMWKMNNMPDWLLSTRQSALHIWQLRTAHAVCDCRAS